ncbi:ATP-grasp domain-containing protein [Skermanella sp. TT6]|mgnify:CR=1 FL=1|uniref:ATP-grasp domain-containing protein n=1 Tax=Skermanella cutis TaxID=2775420 RepID=A0ABX7BCC9_9PROT|nr:ATP-grasp domain-containing protein [Skermanella sp. TT6]QQP92053.1 ATP-grasp domain-containing protein [Skermanella sp. TT6]
MSEKQDKRALACVMGDMNMVRALGMGGIGCALVTQPGDPALHSRYTRQAVFWDDFENRHAELIDLLVDFASRQPEPPVLYYQQDAQLLMVSRHRDRLAKSFRFVVPEAELVEDLVDKARFQVLAERLQLPVPRTRRIDFSVGAPDTGPSDIDLRFPIIVKPLTRYVAWGAIGGAGKALRVESPGELQALWPDLIAGGMDLLAQEMIPGPETRIESYHCYVDGAGSVVGEYTGRKIRTYPEALGHSTALTITDEADVRTLGREMVDKLALTGVAKFDFKRAPDGTLHLLEVNPRFNLWHYVGAVAGVNLPALVYGDLLGLRRSPVPRARAGASWCNITRDKLAARESGVSMAEWWAWMIRCEAKSITLRDPMPFLRKHVSRVLPARWR